MTLPSYLFQVVPVFSWLNFGNWQLCLLKGTVVLNAILSEHKLQQKPQRDLCLNTINRWHVFSFFDYETSLSPVLYTISLALLEDSFRFFFNILLKHSCQNFMCLLPQLLQCSKQRKYNLPFIHSRSVLVWFCLDPSKQSIALGSHLHLIPKFFFGMFVFQ